jgi:hypothetical protein
MSEETPILKGALVEELAEFFKSIGEPGYRGKQAFIRINRFQARSLSEFTKFHAGRSVIYQLGREILIRMNSRQRY